ncbi:MAG: hypothetical protein WCS20_08500 [Alphaproteobacteria bacterium]|jgi:hypothetical protein
MATQFAHLALWDRAFIAAQDLFHLCTDRATGRAKACPKCQDNLRVMGPNRCAERNGTSRDTFPIGSEVKH